VAGFGTTVGFIFGIAADSPESLLYSLLFCLLAAGIFALTRVKNDRVPQEAIIGLAYAITAAASLIVVQKTNGIEHMEGILVGNLLFVKWGDIIAAAGAYTVVGIVHWVFRKRFFQISNDAEGAVAAGVNVRLWDFLFYATFGFVITFSVHVAGVLLVFVFLVAPAILAVMVTDNPRYQLLIGWGVGTLVTVAGMFVSVWGDLTTGPTVVASYGVMLALAALIMYVLRSKSRVKALGRSFAVVAVLGTAVFGLVKLGEAMGERSDAQHSHDVEDMFADLKAKDAERTAEALDLGIALDEGEDPLDCWARVEKSVKENVDAGLPKVVRFLERSDAPLFCREQALTLLDKYAHKNFHYDVEAEDNSQAVAAMRSWLDERRRANQPGLGRGQGGPGRALGPGKGRGMMGLGRHERGTPGS